jgi:putative endonuclease
LHFETYIFFPSGEKIGIARPLLIVAAFGKSNQFFRRFCRTRSSGFVFEALDIISVDDVKPIAPKSHFERKEKTLRKPRRIAYHSFQKFPCKIMAEIFSLDIQNKALTEATSSRALGERGERIAAEFLLKKGYRLAAANFKVPVGRNNRGAQITGEIDLIAYDANVLCFVEVKTRSSDEFASPLAAVDARKQRQITRAARMYRKIFRLHDARFRFDVVAIVLKKDARPEIELFKGFWSEAKFAKKFWADDF